MEYDLTSLSSDELIALYHKVNTELTQQFLSRASWNEQQTRINTLSKISKELVHRKVDFGNNRKTG